MKLTTQQLLDLRAALISAGPKKFPLKASFTMATSKRLVFAVLEDVEAIRIHLCNEHCDKDENGVPLGESKNFVFTHGLPAFTSAWNEVLKEEHDLLMNKLLSYKDLEGCTPDELYGLHPLIDPTTLE